jgi:hypothetical protein
VHFFILSYLAYGPRNKEKKKKKEGKKKLEKTISMMNDG